MMCPSRRKRIGQPEAMNKKTTSGTAPVHQWRKRCQRFPHLFASLAGNVAEQRQAERWEAEAIAILVCDFQALNARAKALRSIVELRECTVRQVAMFFELEADVVVAALSLLPEAQAPVVQPVALPALVKAA